MGQTVLVVDDNALNRELLRLVLEQQGYAVVEATTAEEALTMVSDAPPALVLMDCHLPGMDGLTATRELKGIEATCGIPVVAVTAHAMPGDRERALAAQEPRECAGSSDPWAPCRTLPIPIDAQCH